MQKLDVRGLSLRGSHHTRNGDRFAVATLNKSMRLHQSNLSLDDDSRLHGTSQGHLLVVTDGEHDDPDPARRSVDAVESIVHYFLDEMPWYHLVDGDPTDVTLALEDALQDCQARLARESGELGDVPELPMTLAFVFWPDLYLAHFGGGRCFLSRDGMTCELTRSRLDDAAHRLDDADFQTRVRDRLRRALRMRRSRIGLEVTHHPLRSGDSLALVTSGVAPARVLREFSSVLETEPDSERACSRLVGDAGDEDKTAVVVRFVPDEGPRIPARAPRPRPVGEAAASLSDARRPAGAPARSSPTTPSPRHARPIRRTEAASTSTRPVASPAEPGDARAAAPAAEPRADRAAAEGAGRGAPVGASPPDQPGREERLSRSA